MPELLSDIAIQRGLGSIPGWSRRGDVLTRLYQFKTFRDAIDFVDSVADACEAMNHHADIDIRYTKVTLTLSSHDAGGITSRDIDLARDIDADDTES